MTYTIVTKQDEYSVELAEIIKKKINIEYDEKTPDIIVSIGGDGTILKSVNMYKDRCDDITIFSINTGHLGFITNFTVEEIDKVCEMINSNKYDTETVGLIDYEVITSLEKFKGVALNEVTCINPTRTLIVEVSVDGKSLELFRGTGLCISSPFGSTGYNKSLHGSVIDPALKCFQLTEIASINSRAYRTLSSPLILSCEKTITIENNESQDTWITVDNTSYRFTNFKSLSVGYSKHVVKMAKNKIEFIGRLKKAFINN